MGRRKKRRNQMQQPAPGNNPSTNQQGIPAQQQPKAPIVNASIGQPQSPQEEQWRKEQKVYWERQIGIAKWLNVITSLAAGIAIVGLIFVYLQARIAAIAADAAVNQARTAEKTL